MTTNDYYYVDVTENSFDGLPHPYTELLNSGANAQLFAAFTSILDKAKEKFNEASDFHFELEGIYSSNISFKKVNEISNTLLTKITEAIK